MKQEEEKRVPRIFNILPPHETKFRGVCDDYVEMSEINKIPIIIPKFTGSKTYSRNDNFGYYNYLQVSYLNGYLHGEYRYYR